jgi:hypothetical protein
MTDPLIELIVQPEFYTEFALYDSVEAFEAAQKQLNKDSNG